MKNRPLIAIIILVLMVTACITEEIMTAHIFQDFIEKIESIQQVENPSVEEVEIIEKWWIDRHVFLEIFVTHVPLNEVSYVFGELKGSIAAKDEKTSTALISKLFSMAIALKEMYAIRLGNIL